MEWLKPWSQPGSHASAIHFQTLEPVIEPLLAVAKPAPINVQADPDGIVRSFPLFYTLDTDSGSRNVYSVVMNLLRIMYRVTNEDIVIEPKQIILRNATVPLIDPKTGTYLMRKMPMPETAMRFQNIPVLEQEEAYRQALYRYCMAEGILGDPEYLQALPVDIRILRNDKWELFRGREILDAADRLHAPFITVRLHQVRDVYLPMSSPGMMAVPFTGKEQVLLQDSESGQPVVYHPFPFISFREAWEMKPLPEIPPFMEGGMADDETTRRMEQWFFEYAHERCGRSQKTGHKEASPEENSFCAYAAFFDAHRITPGAFRSWYPEFSRWAEANGYAQASALNEQWVIRKLLECYRSRIDTFTGKAVIVGGTAKALGDVHVTPLGPMPGITMITNALNGVLTEAMIRFSRDVFGLNFILLLTFCIIISFSYAYFPYRWLSAGFLVTTVGIVVVTAVLLHFSRFLIESVPLLLANLLLAIGMLIFKLITEEKDKKFLHRTFSTYLSGEVIEELVHNRSVPTLGGEERVISALFSDIANFTTISERLEPSDLILFMNEYLTAMTDIVLDEKGTLDKYVGDAIVAFFGAPLDLPDHALRACRCAVRMQEYLNRMVDEWKRKARLAPEGRGLCVRIGINTGRMVVGNMGSRLRMNYTIMGDEVNLASRLEGAAKQYGVSVLVSANTVGFRWTDDQGASKSVSEEIATRYLDRVRVMGRRNPVDIFEVLGFQRNLDERNRNLKELFEKGIALFRESRFDEARKAFEKASEFERNLFDLSPSGLYLSRIKDCKNSSLDASKMITDLQHK